MIHDIHTHRSSVAEATRAASFELTRWRAHAAPVRAALECNELARLQPQFVKVDGIIVRRILDHPKALDKLVAIQRFCRIHHARLIAECVENQPILAKLIEVGIGLAQGFGIAMPQPIADSLRS